MSERFLGKVCILTGTGEQRPCAALTFAREGASVVGCGLEVEAAQSTLEAVRASGGLNALSALFDGADAESLPINRLCCSDRQHAELVESVEEFPRETRRTGALHRCLLKPSRREVPADGRPSATVIGWNGAYLKAKELRSELARAGSPA